MPPALSFYFWPKFVQCVECPHPHPQFRCKGQWNVPKSPIFSGGMAPQSPSYPTSMLVSILEFYHVKTSDYTKQTLDMLHKIIQK